MDWGKIDLSVFAVSIPDSFRVSLSDPENNITAHPTDYEQTSGPEFLVDQDLSTFFLQPEGNQSYLKIDLKHPGRATAISFTSSSNENRNADPESVLVEGLENNGSFSVISELLIPPLMCQVNQIGSLRK